MHRMELAGAGGLAPHANGADRIQAVTLTVRSHAGAEAIFARTYALHPRGAPYPDNLLGAEARSLQLPEEHEYIELASPTGPGIAQQRLTSAGEGVCSVDITVASLDDTRAFLRERGIAHTLSDTSLLVAPSATLNIPVRFVPASYTQ
jgi:hypothetical protein